MMFRTGFNAKSGSSVSTVELRLDSPISPPLGIYFRGVRVEGAGFL